VRRPERGPSKLCGEIPGDHRQPRPLPHETCACQRGQPCPHVGRGGVDVGRVASAHTLQPFVGECARITRNERLAAIARDGREQCDRSPRQRHLNEQRLGTAAVDRPHVDRVELPRVGLDDATQVLGMPAPLDQLALDPHPHASAGRARARVDRERRERAQRKELRARQREHRRERTQIARLEPAHDVDDRDGRLTIKRWQRS